MIHRFLRLAAAMALVAGVAATGVTVGVSPAAAAAVVNGEGSNFTLTAMQQWLVHFPNVNYQGIGSPDGLNQFFPPQGPQAAQPIQFVETDIPYTQGQLQTHADYPPRSPSQPAGVWSYVPVAAGGISFMYHLADANGQPVGTLRLNQEAIAKIMTFQITNWNNVLLADLNPGIALPNRPIHLVVDSTASGQTYLMSQYLLSNPATAAMYQAYTHDTLPQANWGPLQSSPTGPVVGPCSPQCIAEAGPASQAEEVSQSSNDGFIAYVPTAYAVSDHEPVAAVQNHAGYYTLPSHDDVTAALDSAYNPNGGNAFDGFEQIDWNAPAKTAYSISTYSYMLLWLSPTKVPGLSQSDADAVASFGEWAITVGQENAYDIGYSPISNALIQFGLKTYEAVPGAPQGVPIPCIPGSEGNHCNQDPPGPCLGGGETAGTPGSCGGVAPAPPPSPLPPGSGGSSAGANTGSGASRGSGPGAVNATAGPTSAGSNRSSRSATASGARASRSGGKAGSTSLTTVAAGASLPASLVVRRQASAGGGGSAFPASLVGDLLGSGAATIAAAVLAVSLIAARVITRRLRKGAPG